MTLEVTMCGAAGMVTGSCYRVRHQHGVFLVDCGLFQGAKTVRELNYRPLPFLAHEPAALLLTHAHIDHSGLIPKLVREGFRGPIFTTQGTADLLEPMLPDSAYIQESEVSRLNRRNHRRGLPPVTPIYTRADVDDALRLVQPVELQEWVLVMEGVRARFWPAGHILGAASIEVEVAEQRLLFSGDIGPQGRSFHANATAPQSPDYLFVESTYGDRERHDPTTEERQDMLAQVVREALAGGGNLLIPAFAVERTQELLYDLDCLFDRGALPSVEVFLDSPLALSVTEVFDRHLPNINQPGTPHPFHRSNLHTLMSAADSQRIERVSGGAIIMAASGMCDAGRIRQHLRNHLWRPDATVLLVGYQAPGTLGRLLHDGVRRVRIHAEEIDVRARIRVLDVYSGHADCNGLLAWIAACQPVTRGIFLMHGEDTARAALRAALIAAGAPADKIIIPGLDTRWALADRGPLLRRSHHPRIAEPRRIAEDWHNIYAQTVLDLAETLRGLADDDARETLLHAVRETLARRVRGKT